MTLSHIQMISFINYRWTKRLLDRRLLDKRGVGRPSARWNHDLLARNGCDKLITEGKTHWRTPKTSNGPK